MEPPHCIVCLLWKTPVIHCGGAVFIKPIRTCSRLTRRPQVGRRYNCSSSVTNSWIWPQSVQFSLQIRCSVDWTVPCLVCKSSSNKIFSPKLRRCFFRRLGRTAEQSFSKPAVTPGTEEDWRQTARDVPGWGWGWLMGCLHDAANVQQFTCILNTSAGSLLDVCWIV